MLFLNIQKKNKGKIIIATGLSKKEKHAVKNEINKYILFSKVKKIKDKYANVKDKISG